jgi:Bacterial OB fold (BOF) protein
MDRRLPISAITFGAILGLLFPNGIRAQNTNIGELQQRSPGVTVTGEVASVVGNDFVLRDNSGEIIVDAGPTWWRRLEIQPGERVTVTGEVSNKSGELDAFSITRSNGSRIDIRPADGPPPWSGGRGKPRK